MLILGFVRLSKNNMPNTVRIMPRRTRTSIRGRNRKNAIQKYKARKTKFIATIAYYHL